MLPIQFYPSETLSDYIDHFGYFEITERIEHCLMLPLGAVQIIFQLESSVFHKTSFTDGWQERPKIFIGGPYDAAYTMKFAPGSKIFTVLFKLGKAHLFFREKINRFANKLIDPQDIWGSAGRRLSEKVFSARHDMERVAILDQFFMRQFQHCGISPIESSVHAIISGQGTGAISELADRAGLSTSHFRKRFREEIGLNAKTLQKILRIKAVVEYYSRYSEISLGELGHQFNYFDQSHLIKEFRSVTGTTPGAYFTGEISLRQHNLPVFTSF